MRNQNMQNQTHMDVESPANQIHWFSRVLGTAACCLLAVGACFADDADEKSKSSKAVADVSAEVTEDAEVSELGAESEAAADTVSELSVGPMEHKIYPDDRPQWISAEPDLEGDRHRWPVVSMPSLSREASLESLEEQKRIAVAAYIGHLTGSTREAAKVIQYDVPYIDVRLVNPDRSYSGVVTASGGEMYEDAVELVFDEAFQQDVMEQWRRSQVKERLAGLGVLGIGGLVLLMGLTSVLKFVHRIRG